MKKRFLIFFVILTFFVSALNVHAQTIDTSGLSDSYQAGQSQLQSMSTTQLRSDYLKQEWGNYLSQNKFTGPIIKVMTYTSPVVNPFFKFTIGVEPSFSWSFILTLAIWIALGIYLFRILNLVSIFSENTHRIISAGMFIIIGLVKIPKTFSDFIINALSLFTNWMMQLFGVILVVLLIVIISFMSKSFERTFKAMKRKKEEQKKESERKKFKSEMKKIEAFDNEALDGSYSN